MKLGIDTINLATDIQKCMSRQEIQQAIWNVMYLQEMKLYIIEGWSSNRNNMTQYNKMYWTVRDKVIMVDIVALKGK